MSRHESHTMHEHSIEAYRTSDFSARALAVLSVYLASAAPLTDREVMARLGFTDGNAVKPRVSELILARRLWQSGKTKDPTTGKTVRVCTATALARREILGEVIR